jgi:hypothetical protein
MRASFNSKLNEHLTKLKARQAHFAAMHPGVGPMKLRVQYWERKSRKLRGSERRKRREELNELIKQIKESQPFWE